MDCNDARPLLNACADGELGAADALRLEEHLAQCPPCAAALDRLRALQSAVREGAPYYRASPALRARIAAALPPVPATDAGPAPRSTSRPRWLDWFDWSPAVNAACAALTVAAVAVGLAQSALRPSAQDVLTDELVASHVRALVSARPVDVVSTDRHTVKPWFNGRLDYAPLVLDLAPEGFPLVGGRVDFVAGRRVAVLVYRRSQHPVDVYVLPPGTGDGIATERKGYQLAGWESGGMRYRAITDASAADLHAFVQAWQAAAKQ